VDAGADGVFIVSEGPALKEESDGGAVNDVNNF